MNKLEILKKDSIIAIDLVRCPQVFAILEDMVGLLDANELNPPIEHVEDMIRVYLADEAFINSEPARKKHAETYLKSLIVELNHQNSESVLGMKINISKFAELVELDLNFIDDFAQLLSGLRIGDPKYFPYFDFDAETSAVSLKTDYEALITEDNTVYALGDKQIEVTQTLLATIVAMENYAAVTKRNPTQIDLEGISFYSNSWHIDVPFVRQYS